MSIKVGDIFNAIIVKSDISKSLGGKKMVMNHLTHHVIKG